LRGGCQTSWGTRKKTAKEINGNEDRVSHLKNRKGNGDPEKPAGRRKVSSGKCRWSLTAKVRLRLKRRTAKNKLRLERKKKKKGETAAWSEKQRKRVYNGMRGIGQDLRIQGGPNKRNRGIFGGKKAKKSSRSLDTKIRDRRMISGGGGQQQ